MGWLLAALIGASVLSTCTGTKYNYVASTSTGTFFKVPGNWRVYRQQQILAHENAIDPAAASRPNFPFFVILDGDPAPSLDHDVTVANFPFGLARVRHLSVDEHDNFSLASLRNEVVNVDQLAASNANAVNVVRPTKLLVHGGLRGSQLEFTVHASATNSFTVDQVGFVDAPTRTVWLLIIGCSTACYKANAASIHRIVDSWTVRAK
jgi:hypothetical protein